MIDLHTHSTFSDGTLTPTELVTLAKNQGLSALALTDHNSISGNDGVLRFPGDGFRLDTADPGDFVLRGQVGIHGFIRLGDPDDKRNVEQSQ